MPVHIRAPGVRQRSNHPFERASPAGHRDRGQQGGELRVEFGERRAHHGLPRPGGRPDARVARTLPHEARRRRLRGCSRGHHPRFSRQ